MIIFCFSGPAWRESSLPLCVFGDVNCHQVPLARSEGNLLELMEIVCERMQDYGEQTDTSTNRKSYIRIKSRSGEAMDLSEATLDTRVTSSLKFAVSTNSCESLIDECLILSINGVGIIWFCDLDEDFTWINYQCF